MEIPSYFDDFLPKIAPTAHQHEVMTREHGLLRERLMQHPVLKPLLLTTFIQGSHRRSTANRGNQDHPCDVDIVAVTNLPRSSTTAAHAHDLFRPFLETHYQGRYEPQERSWCISVDPEVKLDLVPTSEPDSEQLREAVIRKALEDWDPVHRLPGGGRGYSLSDLILEAAKRDKDFNKAEPLWIPDRKLKIWEQTHPLHLIGWTAEKNLSTNGHFLHVVRVIKWWRRAMQPHPKHPKGYPLEHMVGECCPDNIKSVAEGIAKALAEIARRYQQHAERVETPFLPSRGVENPPVNVMSRVTPEDFADFHALVVDAAAQARRAIEADDVRGSARLWAVLLGN